MEGVLRKLSATRGDVASVINIAFSSKDPVKASTIANAVVDTYLEAGIAGKVKSTKIAGKVVQERVDELKRQAGDAERAVLEYKIANNLTGNSRAGCERATRDASVSPYQCAGGDGRGQGPDGACRKRRS